MMPSNVLVVVRSIVIGQPVPARSLRMRARRGGRPFAQAGGADRPDESPVETAERHANEPATLLPGTVTDPWRCARSSLWSSTSTSRPARPSPIGRRCGLPDPRRRRARSPARGGHASCDVQRGSPHFQRVEEVVMVVPTVQEFLRRANVPYTVFPHARAYTAQEEAAVTHI